MSFPCLEGQLVAAILITAALGTLSHQIAPGALSEALKIENKRKTTTTTPLFIQTVYNHRFGRYRPSTFSHCCNCPLKQEVLFLGTPCRSMNALDGGAFCCGSGVGFPISFGRCEYRFCCRYGHFKSWTCFKSGGLASFKAGILCLECLLWKSVSQQLTAFIYESCNELTIILLILAVCANSKNSGMMCWDTIGVQSFALTKKTQKNI